MAGLPRWDRRRSLRSIAETLGLFMILLPMYVLAFPHIETAVVAGANIILPALPGDVRLERVSDGGWMIVAASGPNPGGSLRFGNERFGRLSLQGLLITTCLLLATPVPWRRRLKLSLLGILCVGALTAASLAVIGCTLATRCADDTGGRLCRNLAGVLSPWSQVICVGVWMGIAGREWIGKPISSRAAAGHGEAARMARSIRAPAGPTHRRARPAPVPGKGFRPSS